MYLVKIICLTQLITIVSGNVLTAVSSVRLVGGNGPYDGTVQLKVRGIWGTICGRNFNKINAAVLCRMMNLSSTGYFHEVEHNRRYGHVYVTDLRCSGHETHVGSCTYDERAICTNSMDAVIMCTACEDLKTGNGQLSISADGSIVTLQCNVEDNYYTSTCSADKTWSTNPLICVQEVCGVPPIGDHSVNIFFSYESIIFGDCLMIDGNYVGLIAFGCDDTTKQWITYSECEHYERPLQITDIQLSNGTRHSDGRVELNVFGQTGTICGDSFGQNEANMICNMMGYSPATSYATDALYGEGSGPIYVSKLFCDENSRDLNDCQYVTENDCTHENDVSVKCTDCGDPTPPNGYVNTTRTNYTTVVEVTCDKDYVLVGDSIITCLLNSSWTGHPYCKLIDCGDPRPENGQVNTTETKNGTVVSVSCDAGYQLSGSAIIVCQMDDTWTNDPTCTINDCGMPSPMNANVALFDNRTTFGAIATITCKEGYEPTEGKIVVCLADAIWEIWQTCEVVECPDPTPFAGTSNSTSTVYGSVVKISCEPPLTITGNSIIHCQGDGTWSDNPVCDPLSCGIPRIANGEVSVGKTFFGSTATVSCVTGFTLSGPNIIICSTSGWNDSSVQCVIQVCGDPTPENGVLVRKTGISYGDAAILSCIEGFELEGDSIISCKVGGLWSSNPQCIRKDCGSLEDPDNGLVKHEQGTKYQAMATYSCNDGYINVGNSTLICQSDGTWSDPAPRCQRLSIVGESCTEDIFCGSKDAKCVKEVCKCITGIYDKATDTCDTMPLFPYGDEYGDEYVLGESLLMSPNHSVMFPPGIPFHGKRYDELHVSPIGHLSFTTRKTRGKRSISNDRFSIVPPHVPDIGQKRTEVYYRSYHILSYDRLVGHKSEIIQIEDIVAKYSKLDTFDISFVMIVTYRVHTDNLTVVKFQNVIATDGYHTASLNIYGDESATRINKSSKSKTSLRGGFLFVDETKVDGLELEVLNTIQREQSDPVPTIECIRWYNNNRNSALLNQLLMSKVLPECPCDLNRLLWDPWFGFGEYRTDNSITCVDMHPTLDEKFAPYGKSCCYDEDWNFVSERPKAGNLYTFHPRLHPVDHVREDVNPKQTCCSSSTQYCDLFYKVRPQGTCYWHWEYVPTWAQGDPHFQTLDGLNFTFNGLGEYTLLRINTDNVTVEVQTRTTRAIAVNGTMTDATIFSAFAAKDNNNASFHVELNRAKSGMNIYSNSEDISKMYYTAAREDIPFIHVPHEGNLIITRKNRTLTILLTNSGISFNVTSGAEMLALTTIIPKKYHNQTSGLLGNFNGIPDDDFTLPNGTVMDLTMSEREIFQYGQQWSISPEESAFVYEDGKSHYDFHNTSFVPRFLEDIDPKKLEAAEGTCNGPQNTECIFDLVFTEREDVAMETLHLKEVADITRLEMNKVMPFISGCDTVNVTVGDIVVCQLNVSEGDGVIFIVNNVNATYDPDDQTVVYEQLDDGPVDVRIVAVDADNEYSLPFVINVFLCTGCNGHGVCTNISRYDDRQTEYFKYATCECDSQYTGDDCDFEFDGCEFYLCSHGRNCTSLSASEQIKQNRTFICGSCPGGFLDGGRSNEICSDIDECEESPCQHACVNTDGSYECECSNGYKTDRRNKHGCTDINECEEYLHNCTQVCNNFEGGHNCSCYPGYHFNENSLSCEVESVTDQVCSQSDLNCSNTAGCYINEVQEAVCFCDAGYELNGTNSCIDVDECGSNTCSQICINTNGSFNCSCLPGYKLVGPTICEECDSFSWGINCENTCDCMRQGTIFCDTVKGCVCKEGWRGTSCDININECNGDGDSCDDAKMVCVDTPGSYYCMCRSGFKKNDDGTCRDFDECVSPLDHNCDQLCVNTEGSYSCQCMTGYKMVNQTLCSDIDECSIGQHNCEQRCANNIGSYNCYCYEGYTLNDDRETCTQLDDPCFEVHNLTCDHFCYVHLSETECRCRDGYKLGTDSQTCLDVDECRGDNLCTDDATCKNTNGSYICQCQDGSRLDNDGRTCIGCDNYHYGKDCALSCSCLNGLCDKITGCVCEHGWVGDDCDEDIDECRLTEAICTGSNAVCLNTFGSFECHCETGYRNVSGECIDINECEESSMNTCTQLCVNTPGSYICECHAGFLFKGNKCIDIDECAGNNRCDQLCENTLGSYICTCLDGYKLHLKTRQSCTPMFKCSANEEMLCGNFTSCYVEDGVANCLCNKGFHNVSGVCKECDYGRYGLRCSQLCSCNETNTLACDNVNGICLCSNGWQGVRCDEDINECDNADSCPSNSTCRNLIGDYTCDCDDCIVEVEDEISGAKRNVIIGVCVGSFLVIALIVGAIVFIFKQNERREAIKRQTESAQTTASI